MHHMQLKKKRNVSCKTDLNQLGLLVNVAETKPRHTNSQFKLVFALTMSEPGSEIAMRIQSFTDAQLYMRHKNSENASFGSNTPSSSLSGSDIYMGIHQFTKQNIAIKKFTLNL